MPLENCRKCGELLIPTLRHRCDPLWYARLDWHETGDNRPIHAATASLAAEKFCEDYDAQGDYSIARMGDAKVIVFDAQTELAGVFDIEVETRPIYYPKEVRLSDDGRKELIYEEADAIEADAETEVVVPK